jgi:hypothetical protein
MEKNFALLLGWITRQQSLCSDGFEILKRLCKIQKKTESQKSNFWSYYCGEFKTGGLNPDLAFEIYYDLKSTPHAALL